MGRAVQARRDRRRHRAGDDDRLRRCDKPTADHEVTDPFGRYATFTYNAAGQLASVTDVLGLTSRLDYGHEDFITALTTPYGVTSFRHEGNDNYVNRFVQATDPLGGTERIESPMRRPACRTPSRRTKSPPGLQRRTSASIPTIASTGRSSRGQGRLATWPPRRRPNGWSALTRPVARRFLPVFRIPSRSRSSPVSGISIRTNIPPPTRARILSPPGQVASWTMAPHRFIKQATTPRADPHEDRSPRSTNEFHLWVEWYGSAGGAADHRRNE